MKRAAVLLSAASAAALLFACSPDPGPFFTIQRFPEDQARFNQGRLGLLTPDLNRENELIAFRLISGLNLDAAYQRPAVPAAAVNQATLSGQYLWLKTRQSVTEPAAPNYINPYRNGQASGSPSRYVFYLNCLDDAFETAARTLSDRRQSYPSSDDFKRWVAAQDQVFSDCSANNPVYPPSEPSTSPAIVRADREYQIAAAHFYAQDLDDAERRFRAIAAGQQSPWQRIASYMVGRTLLREVSLQGNTAAAAGARQQFATLANDPVAGTLGDSAKGLLQHLDAIQNAGPVMQSLSGRILSPTTTTPDLENAIEQSAYILAADSFRNALSRPDTPDPFDWVHSLENGDATHILDRWQTLHSLPWLTLALMYVNGQNTAASQLIAEEDRLTPDSPAFATAKYNAIRLRIERGETEAPRKQLDAVLAAGKEQPASLLNAWRAERMRLATSFDDLLLWAPRTPVDAEIYAPSSGKEFQADSPVLAADSVYLLNSDTPLTKLALAAHSAELPSWSKADIAVVAWTRAVMLNQPDILAAAAPVIAELHPDWKATVTPAPAGNASEWKFRAALLMASHSDFQPQLHVDYREHVGQQSWWCAVVDPHTAAQTVQPGTISWRMPTVFDPPVSVISQQERTSATVEVEKLSRLGSAQAFFAPIIFDWANTHPNDPLVPQALHQLVVVVRYGCRIDPSSGQVSKRAFELLHQRYPRSEWTTKTPYWFN